jgi:hypothetical protein
MNDKFSGCLRNLDIRKSPSNHNLLSKFQCMIKIMYGMVNDISAKKYFNYLFPKLLIHFTLNRLSNFPTYKN